MTSSQDSAAKKNLSLKMVSLSKILHGLAPVPLLLLSLLLFAGVIALGEAACAALGTADHRIRVWSVHVITPGTSVHFTTYC